MTSTFLFPFPQISRKAKIKTRLAEIVPLSCQDP